MMASAAATSAAATSAATTAAAATAAATTAAEELMMPRENAAAQCGGGSEGEGEVGIDPSPTLG